MDLRPGNSHSVLMEFECLMDIDLGVLKYLLMNVEDEDERFYHGLLVLKDDYLRGLIHDNPDMNPVRIVMDIEDYKLADEIYEDILNNHLSEVIKYGGFTGLRDFTDRISATEGMCRLTILCSNSVQYSAARAIFENRDSMYYQILLHDFIDESEPDALDVSSYTVLFIRHMTNLFRYENIEGKTIYLQECRTNLNIDAYMAGTGLLPNRNIDQFYLENCRIMIYSPYQYTNDFFINGDYPFDDEFVRKTEPEFVDEDYEEKVMEEERKQAEIEAAMNDRVLSLSMLPDFESEEDLDDEFLSPEDFDILKSQFKEDE